MKTLLLFTEDRALHETAAQLPKYQIIVPDASAWHDQHFDLCLLDISTWPLPDAGLIEHVEAVAELVIILANAEDQAHFADFASAYDYMLKPLTIIRLEKRLQALAQNDGQLEQYHSQLRHELKNPLASIVGYADLLLSATDDPDVRENIGGLTEKQVSFLTSVHRSALRLREMIDTVGREAKP